MLELEPEEVSILVKGFLLGVGVTIGSFFLLAALLFFGLML